MQHHLWPRKYSRSHGGYCLLTVYSLALCSANFFTYPRSACSEIVPSLVVWAPRIGHQLKLSLIDMTIGDTDLGSSSVEVTSYQVTLYHIKLTRKTSRYTLGYHEILASFFWRQLLCGQTGSMCSCLSFTSAIISLYSPLVLIVCHSLCHWWQFEGFCPGHTVLGFLVLWRNTMATILKLESI